MSVFPLFPSSQLLLSSNHAGPRFPFSSMLYSRGKRPAVNNLLPPILKTKSMIILIDRRSHSTNERGEMRIKRDKLSKGIRRRLEREYPVVYVGRQDSLCKCRSFNRLQVLFQFESGDVCVCPLVSDRSSLY